MRFNGIVVMAYGIVVMLGGLIGYLTARSLPSLFAGTICGAALVAVAMCLFRDSTIAYFVSLGVTALLTGFFIFRYISTYKLMPAGIMSVLSLIVFILLLTTRGKRPKHELK